MRIALAQIASTPEPGRTSSWSRAQVAAAAADGARIVVFPEATMCCFGVKLGPVAEPLDGPWAARVREIAADAGITVVVGHVHPGRRRPGAQHAAGHRRRRRGELRQDPPVRRVRVRRVRHRGARRRAGDHRGRRADGRPGHLLRPALPRAVPAAGRPRRGAGRGAGVVGRRAGQARAVGPAGAGPRAGLDHLRRRLRPGRPDHGGPGSGQGAHRDRGQRGGRPARARSSTSSARRPACWWWTSTPARWTPPARWSRCSPTAASRTRPRRPRTAPRSSSGPARARRRPGSARTPAAAAGSRPAAAPRPRPAPTTATAAPG